MEEAGYWKALELLLASHSLVIDRPRGSSHPRYSAAIYPLDYGYLEGTTSGDGAGIDVWRGTHADKSLTGILCTLDNIKRDAEIKLLVGCTADDLATIQQFYRGDMHTLFIPRLRE
jgi:inorganic pyrophosphatase